MKSKHTYRSQYRAPYVPIKGTWIPEKSGLGVYEK
jgi:hypothetical protein